MEIPAMMAFQKRSGSVKLKLDTGKSLDVDYQNDAIRFANASHLRKRFLRQPNLMKDPLQKIRSKTPTGRNC